MMPGALVVQLYVDADLLRGVAVGVPVESGAESLLTGCYPALEGYVEVAESVGRKERVER